MIRLGRDKLRKGASLGRQVIGCLLFEASNLGKEIGQTCDREVNTLSERGSMLASLHAALRCV